MPIQNGIDIIEISRIRTAIENRGDKFKERVFTENEIRYCESKNNASYQSYAVRFAAKEAASKALGYGIGVGIDWKDIEILNNKNEKPFIVLTGNALIRYSEMSGRSISVSLSHCRSYAVAQVIIETSV